MSPIQAQVRQASPISKFICTSIADFCRAFPCQSCIRRGCAGICPEGTLTATKGNKVLMVHAQRLSEQVKSMTARIRELEEALDESHKSNRDGSGPYPFLQAPSQSHERVELPELRTIYDDIEVRDISDSIGSLSIDVDGRTKYHGESVGSEYFQPLFPPDGYPSQQNVPTDPKYLGLPFEIIDLCNAYPFGLRDSQYTKFLFLPFLPPRERALQLTELYYQNVAWLNDPIIRDDFMTNILTPLYGHTGSPNIDSIHSHRLSVFFILLASGVLYDESPSSAVLAEQYHALSRAALSLDPIHQDATCATVQALVMTFTHIYHSDRTNNEARWLLMGVAARVAQLIGLQRDNAGWGLGYEEVQRRRILFWEIYTCDAWTSIVNGRPPALSINHTDCRFPEDLDPMIKPSGAVEMGWHVWKFRYSASCLGISVQHVFNTRAPSYSALLELDRKIRKFDLPSHLQSPMEASEAGRAWSSEAPRAMQQYCALCEREANLLYIHRSWFVQAIREAPVNPLQHKYAPSVLAVYRSACRLISSLKGLYRVHPHPTNRTWFFWSPIFSSCIVLGAIVLDSPQCTLASNALQELEQGMLLYEQGSLPCRPPATMLVLHKLRERAISSFNAAQVEAARLHRSSFNPADPDLLGGRNSVIASTASTSPASSPSGSDRRLSELSDDFARQADPSIIQYYGALANPNLVLPATREFELPSAQTFESCYSATSQEDLNTPSPFFDPALQAAMKESTHSNQNIAGPSSSVPQQQPLSHPQVAPHPYFTEAHYNSNQEEVWRNYINSLGVMKP
ncbi:fungal-specific transcription factor domain-containing protein [Suillus ampliporus]|nr:fungal-specific transcription factor domain-containing protein [Suillus ampliporus]